MLHFVEMLYNQNREFHCLIEKATVMTDADLALQVYEAGPLTVVGFGGAQVLDQVNLAHCREELMSLIKEHDCKTLAFDLAGVRLVPSGFLGLMASMRDLGVEVQVYNPSDDVREVLEITKLNAVISIHEVDP